LIFKIWTPAGLFFIFLALDGRRDKRALEI